MHKIEEMSQLYSDSTLICKSESSDSNTGCGEVHIIYFVNEKKNCASNSELKYKFLLKFPGFYCCNINILKIKMVPSFTVCGIERETRKKKEKCKSKILSSKISVEIKKVKNVILYLFKIFQCVTTISAHYQNFFLSNKVSLWVFRLWIFGIKKF